MNPRYPIYIISKGRYEDALRLTARALAATSVPYRIVVEPQELEAYAEHEPRDRLLALPFSNLGQGSIPARNWVWEHSISEGHARHWIMDDNIQRFYRFNRNAKNPVADGTIFAASEDFTERYTNVPMSGLNYESFVMRRAGDKYEPFTLNTRVYSCILLSSSIPHRWRGRYNEDTDLSLRILKDGYCTILFNAFLANKLATMRMAGGNTDELYRQDKKFDGRWAMAESLRKQHPDVTKVVWKWNRWQHQVDYRPFKANRLKRREVAERDEKGEYGMRLRRVT